MTSTIDKNLFLTYNKNKLEGDFFENNFKSKGYFMKTGFNELDKIIDIGIPQLILLTGIHLIKELSGDIANNVCFRQQDDKDYNVLEIVRCRKEYIIQRMIINEANINYRNWYYKEKYTDEELQRIGKAVINVINAPNRIPRIIEQDLELYDLRKVAKLIENYANEYADREDIKTLVVVDIFPLSSTDILYIKKNGIKRHIEYKKKRREILKFIKDLKTISYKLKCPILVLYNNENSKCNYLTKDNINKINKYVDKLIITNIDETNTYNVDVYNKTEKIGECKLKYDCNIRKFYDYK